MTTVKFHRFLLASLFLFSSIQGQAIAGPVIAMGEGIGETVEKATDNALRRAIQNVNGALTITERQITDDDLKEFNVSVSQGIVQNYSVLSAKKRTDGLISVEVKAEISDSKLKSRFELLDNKKGVNLSGLGTTLRQEIERAKAEERSIQNANDGNQALFKYLIQQWPKAAYGITVGETYVSKNEGTVKVAIPIKISRDENYFNNLDQAISRIYQTPYPNSEGRSHIDKGSMWLYMSPTSDKDLACGHCSQKIRPKTYVLPMVNPLSEMVKNKSTKIIIDAIDENLNVLGSSCHDFNKAISFYKFNENYGASAAHAGMSFKSPPGFLSSNWEEVLMLDADENMIRISEKIKKWNARIEPSCDSKSQDSRSELGSSRKYKGNGFNAGADYSSSFGLPPKYPGF